MGTSESILPVTGGPVRKAHLRFLEGECQKETKSFGTATHALREVNARIPLFKLPWPGNALLITNLLSWWRWVGKSSRSTSLTPLYQHQRARLHPGRRPSFARKQRDCDLGAIVAATINIFGGLPTHAMLHGEILGPNRPCHRHADHTFSSPSALGGLQGARPPEAVGEIIMAGCRRRIVDYKLWDGLVNGLKYGGPPSAKTAVRSEKVSHALGALASLVIGVISLP